MLFLENLLKYGLLFIALIFQTITSFEHLKEHNKFGNVGKSISGWNIRVGNTLENEEL